MYIKKFSEFYESRISNNSFNDNYDFIFAEYAIDEVPFHFNEKEREECKKLYGNVDVGVVYHGGKINTKELLDTLESINKKENNKIFLSFKSATPDELTAKSFAWYVKSYDTLTTLSNLKTTYDHGSSGKYGSYIIKLRPSKDNVIYSTFGDTEEKLTRTAETECILYGDVEVLDVNIYYPLSVDNYKDEIKKTSIFDLNNNHFLKSWLSHKKIPIPQELVDDKVIKLNGNDLIDLLTSDFSFGTINYKVVSKNPNFREVYNKFTFKENNVYLNDKLVKCFNIKDSDYINTIKDLFEDDILNSAKELDKKIEVKHSRLHKLVFTYNTEVYTLINLCNTYDLDLNDFSIIDKFDVFFTRYENSTTLPIEEFIDLIYEYFHDIVRNIRELVYIDKHRTKLLVRSMIKRLSDSRELNDIIDSDKKKNYIYFIGKAMKELLPLL